MWIVYCRKSTDREDKQALSLDSQEEWGIGLAKKLGIADYKVIKEAMSAKKPSRPVFTEIMNLCYSGGITGIIVWKLDRLARCVIDGGSLSWILQQGIIQKIITSDREYLSTDNVLMMSLEFGMANQFIIELRKNTKRGMATKAKEGGWNFVAPFGYKNNRLEKTIEPDPEREMYAKLIFQLKLQDYSYSEIADRINKMGVTGKRGGKLGRSHIEKILKNRIYAGMVEFAGECYKGNHKPIISKKLFDEVQDILEKNKRVKTTKHSFAFRGFFTCGHCGCSITAEKQKGHVYYRCTKKRGKCGQKYVREDRMQGSILDFIKENEPDERLYPKMEEAINDILSADNLIRKEDINAITRKISALNNEFSMNLAMRRNEEISKEIFIAEKSKIENQIRELQKERSKMESLNGTKQEEIKFALELMFSLYSWAKNATPYNMGNYLKIIGSNFFMQDEKLVCKRFSAPFEIIKRATCTRWLPTKGNARTFLHALIGCIDEWKILMQGKQPMAV